MNNQSQVSGRIVDVSETFDDNVCYWRYLQDQRPTFDSRLFDNDWITASGLVSDLASAGRGGTSFIHTDDYALVLRHYYRGGLMRTFSDRRYFWNGLKRTRAWREFDILCYLEQQQLPAPKPYACEIRKYGLSYTASLISHFISGETLAQRVCTHTPSTLHWKATGRCIRHFHDAGVNHADLNAHNILLYGSTGVSLIDFDKAKLERGRSIDANWRKANVARLKRSLEKIAASGPVHLSEDNWAQLLDGYHNL